jgi:WD40 repeat protein
MLNYHANLQPSARTTTFYFVWFLLALVSSSPFFAQTNATILEPRTGHTQGARHIATARSAPIAVTASNDGSILVWNTQEPRLEKRITIAHNTLSILIVHPMGTSFAYLTPAPNGNFLFVAYSIHEGNRLFQESIDNLPLSLQYSPNGTLISMSFAQVNSVRLFSSSTGRQQRGLNQPFGIVDLGFLSSSNATFMGYQSNRGLITYHRVQTGEELAQISTIRNLESIQLQSNNTLAIGRSQNTLFLMNVVNGEVLNQRNFNQLHSAHLVDDSTLGVVIRNDNRFILYWLDISQRTIPVPQATTAIRIESSTGLFTTSWNNGIISAETNGSISLLPTRSDRILIATVQNLIPVGSILRASDYVVIASQLGIQYFREQEAFALLGQPNTASSIITNTVTLPFQGTPGIGLLNETIVMIWNSSGPGRIWLADFSDSQNPNLRAVTETRTNPIRSIRVQGSYLIIFYFDDSIEVLQVSDFRRILEYNTLGLQDAIIFNDEYLIIAKSTQGALGSALIRVDLFTQETAIVGQDDQLVFSISAPPGAQEFYTLGISHPNQGNTTNFRRYTRTTGNQFQTQLITTFNGEDLGARILHHRGNIYTSLGRERASFWDGRRMALLDPTRRIPRQIIGIQDFIGAINADGTASFWSPGTRRFSAEVALMSSGEILMMGADQNTVILSPRPINLTTSELSLRFLDTRVQLQNIRIQ